MSTVETRSSAAATNGAAPAATPEPIDLEATLREWGRSAGASAAFVDALVEIAETSAELAARTDLRIAHLLHHNLRAEATTDSLPEDRIATTRAPDLAVAPAPGPRTPLPAPPDDEEAERHLALVRRRRSTPLYGERAMTAAELSGVLAGALQAKELAPAYHRRDIPRRVFPSAGGLQPVDAHVLVQRVDDVAPGVYRYDPLTHELVQQEAGDPRTRVLDATIFTEWLFDAAAVVVLSADLDRVMWKYGSRAYRYLLMDTGVVCGQLYLAATSLELSVNAVAAFRDDALNAMLRLDGVTRFANLLVGLGPQPRRPG